MTMSGVNRLVDAIERTPLAWPMALLMAGASAFLVYAVPAAIVERAIGMAGIAPLSAVAVPFGMAARGVLALVVALLSGGAVWALFDRLEGGRRVVDEDADIDLFAPAPAPEPVAEAAPQLRRADAHPDAPARRPIFAASDLGTPMDDVDTGKTPFGRAPLFADPAPVAWAEDDLLVLDESYSMAEEAMPTLVVPVATVVPRIDPVGDESIAGLMARLERGLERRGGPGAVTPDDPDGGLRHALEELRRMTTGR